MKPWIFRALQMTFPKMLLAVLLFVFSPIEALTEEVELCVFGTGFKVPLIPQLHGHEEFHKNAETNELQIDVTGLLVFSAYRRTPDASPILDSILGRKSSYALRQLKIGNISKARRQKWSNVRPSFRTRPGGTIRFTPEQLKFFGHPIQFVCSKGLPVYSDDPDTHSCLGIGLGPGKSSLSFSFSTGRDLDGHWPISPQNWEERNWQSWATPLKEIEDAIQKMALTEREKCASE